MRFFFERIIRLAENVDVAMPSVSRYFPGFVKFFLFFFGCTHGHHLNPPESCTMRLTHFPPEIGFAELSLFEKSTGSGALIS